MTGRTPQAGVCNHYPMPKASKYDKATLHSIELDSERSVRYFFQVTTFGRISLTIPLAHQMIASFQGAIPDVTRAANVGSMRQIRTSELGARFVCEYLPRSELAPKKNHVDEIVRETLGKRCGMDDREDNTVTNYGRDWGDIDNIDDITTS